MLRDAWTPKRAEDMDLWAAHRQFKAVVFATQHLDPKPARLKLGLCQHYGAHKLVGNWVEELTGLGLGLQALLYDARATDDF